MPTVTALARLALAELDASEPHRAPVQVPIRLADKADVDKHAEWPATAWDDFGVQAAVRDDPSNAAIYRPHLVAACRQLDIVGYRAPGVRCNCGYGLGFLALSFFRPPGHETIDTRGVMAIWGRRRNPPKERASWDGQYADGAYGLKATSGRGSGDGLSWRAVLGGWGTVPKDAPCTATKGTWGFAAEQVCRRIVFACPKCGRRHVVLNVTLVREVLKAIVEGIGEVVLGQEKGIVGAAPRYAERCPDRGSARAWSTRRPRRPS